MRDGDGATREQLKSRVAKEGLRHGDGATREQVKSSNVCRRSGQRGSATWRRRYKRAAEEQLRVPKEYKKEQVLRAGTQTERIRAQTNEPVMTLRRWSHTRRSLQQHTAQQEADRSECDRDI